MGRLARSRKHRSIRDNQRKFRTRARTKDLDQIFEDVGKIEQYHAEQKAAAAFDPSPSSLNIDIDDINQSGNLANDVVVSSTTTDSGKVHKLCIKPMYPDHPDPEEDLPGMGNWYCVECAKYFIDENAMIHHKKSKIHKRRVKLLKTEVPYSQAEAEAAVGLTTQASR